MWHGFERRCNFGGLPKVFCRQPKDAKMAVGKPWDTLAANCFLDSIHGCKRETQATGKNDHFECPIIPVSRHWCGYSKYRVLMVSS